MNHEAAGERGWLGHFVSSSADGLDDIDQPCPYIRTEFTLVGAVRKAVLHFTALGLIEVYLNGTRAGDEVLSPGWSSYRHRLMVTSHDVTELLRPGVNAVGMILGEGWAVGRLTEDRKRRNLWAKRPAGFVQLDLHYEDGTVGPVVSNSDWRTGTGAIVRSGLYDGEHYDARLEPPGWDRPGFDDSDWSNVEVVPWDTSTLIRQAVEPIRRIEELAPVEVRETASGRTVVDFGQNLTGWVRLTVEGQAGTTVTLRHTETLIGGEPDFETNRSAEATDRYTLRGDSREVWEPRFTFHGFRYVDVEGWPGEIRPESLRAIVIHSDMKRVGWFESSDPMLNRLHSNIVWSMRGNFVGVPTDCPQRDERLGWTGDINAFAPTAVFLYDVRRVLSSWLEDLAAEQNEKGYVPYVVPDAYGHPCTPTALWGDAAVSLPWRLYQEYGDRSILERQYQSMTRFVESVEGLLDQSGLWSRGFQFGDWLDPDAPPKEPMRAKTDRHLVATAYFCKVAREIAEVADTLGREADTVRWRGLHGRVRDAFRHEWVAPSGLLANDTATAYALAIRFDLLDPDQEARAGDRLVHLVTESGYRISTGFAGTPHLLFALSRTGHLDTAYSVLLEQACPSFLYPVTMGATTIWERWDAILPDGSLNSTGMTSLNHYALGAVADWLHQVVGGICPSRPGYRSLNIDPRPGGRLRHARVAHDTALGRVEVGWRIEEAGGFFMQLSVPQGATARVTLPDHPDGTVLQVGEGEHRWHYQPVRSGRDKYDLDTPLKMLIDDPEIWPRVKEVFERYFPGQQTSGGDRDGQPARATSLRAILGLIPMDMPELESDLVQALRAGNQGGAGSH